MEEILRKQKTLILCSLNENDPKLSYIPYVSIKGKFYAYVSEIAEHYTNMMNNNNVKVMIIEDESISKTNFMRRRVCFNGTVQQVEDNEKIFKELGNEHGIKMIEILRRMDFQLIEISVYEGKITKGFGKSYKVYWNGENWVEEKIIDIKKHSDKKK